MVSKEKYLFTFQQIHEKKFYAPREISIPRKTSFLQKNCLTKVHFVEPLIAPILDFV